jgi:hypothetical protein
VFRLGWLERATIGQAEVEVGDARRHLDLSATGQNEVGDLVDQCHASGPGPGAQGTYQAGLSSPLTPSPSSAQMTALRTAGDLVVVGFGEPAEFFVGVRGRAPDLDTAAVTGMSVRANQHV